MKCYRTARRCRSSHYHPKGLSGSQFPNSVPERQPCEPVSRAKVERFFIDVIVASRTAAAPSITIE
jgi:hypothetical protein